MELTPSQLCQLDAGYWAMTKKIRLQKGRWDFKDREYQVEVMSCDSKRQCDMKGTQGGFSEAHMTKSLHGMLYGRYPGGVLYLFPTGDDVSDFSKSRFGPLIDANRKIFGKYISHGKAATDATGLKRITSIDGQITANLYLRGARLSQKVQGSTNESSKLRGITVDIVVYDELDMMDQDAIEIAENRMGDSEICGERYISNPLLPDYGIDIIFQKSDQRHWFRECQSCGTYTSAELSFPQCVKFYTKPRNGKIGYIACDKCGKELSVGPGKWIPQVKIDYDDPRHIVGRRWSQLSSSKRDPGLILRQLEEAESNGDPSRIYRYKLGLPYASNEEKLSIQAVLDCCGNYPASTHDQGPCAMGVDVGKVKHIVIGKRLAPEKYAVIRAMKVDTWEEIHDLARQYNVKAAVVDIRPYQDEARRFQREEPYTVYLSEYKDNPTHGFKYDAKTGIVSAGRTELLDQTHHMITSYGMTLLPRLSPEMKEFARQMCNIAKVLEVNEKTGIPIYRYKPTGNKEEHFRHAFGYFRLASQLTRPAATAKARQKKAIHQFSIR